MTSIRHQAAAAIARRSPVLRQATRSIITILAALRDTPRATESLTTQRALATIIGHILTICDLTGEAPSECMTRLGFTSGWRQSINRVKGPAGDKMRALQAKKKNRRRVDDDPEVAAAKMAATERQYNIAAEAFDSGMDAAKVWAYAEAEDARRQAALADTAIDVTSAMGLTDPLAP